MYPSELQVSVRAVDAISDGTASSVEKTGSRAKAGPSPSARNGIAGTRNRGPGETPPYGQEVADRQEQKAEEDRGAGRRFRGVLPRQQRKTDEGDDQDRRDEHQATVADEDLCCRVPARSGDAEQALGLLGGVLVRDVPVREMKWRAEGRSSCRP